MAGRPFALGQSDCALWLADWVMRARGIRDPAAHLRGRYSTPEEWQALLGEGGIRSAVESICSTIGLDFTSSPRCGDIGVVRVEGLGELGAIMGFRGWMMRSSFSSGAPGIAFIGYPPMLAAWRV